MSKDRKEINRRLEDNLKTFQEVSSESEMSGYFLLATMKSKSSDHHGSIYSYSSTDYVRLLGFLETFVLELKTSLLANLSETDHVIDAPDDRLDEKVDKDKIQNLITNISKKIQ
jgi:hypothetical protein